VKNSRTKTTLFVLPLLGLEKEIVITDNFKNAYLDIKNKQCVIVYKSKRKLINIGNLDNFLDLFLKGKYSQISNQNKFQILSFWGLTKRSKLYSILNPKDFLFEDTGILSSRVEIFPPPLVKEEFINK